MSSHLVWIELSGGVALTGAYYPKKNLDTVLHNLKKQGYTIVDIRETR